MTTWRQPDGVEMSGTEDQDAPAEGEQSRPTLLLPIVGAVAGIVVGAAVGWIAVPNSLVPYDTPDAHLRLAVASALAGGLAGALLARRAYRRPASSCLRFGLAAGLLLGLIEERLVDLPGAWDQPLASYLFRLPLLAAVPWLSTAAFLWVTAILAVGYVAETPRPDTDRRAGRARLARAWLRAFASASVPIALIVALFGWNVRHADWPRATPDAVYRPTTYGEIASLDASNGVLRLELVDGRQLDLDQATALDGSSPPNVGDLYLGGTDNGPWYIILRPAAGTVWCGSPPGNTWASPVTGVSWVRGDYVLLSNGLELPAWTGWMGAPLPLGWGDFEVQQAGLYLVDGDGHAGLRLSTFCGR